MAVVQQATGIEMTWALANPNDSCTVRASGPVSLLDGVAEPRVSCSVFSLGLGVGYLGASCTTQGEVKIYRMALDGTFGGYAFNSETAAIVLQGTGSGSARTLPDSYVVTGIESGQEYTLNCPTFQAVDGRRVYDCTLTRPAGSQPQGGSGKDDPPLRRGRGA